MLLQSCDCWSQGAHDRIRQCCIWPWPLTIARFACRKAVEGAGRDGAGGMTGLDSTASTRASSFVCQPECHCDWRASCWLRRLLFLGAMGDGGAVWRRLLREEPVR
jgi:hypothetical protein